MKDIALIFASVRPVIVLPTKSQERPSSPFYLLPSRDWRDCRELLFGGTLQTERHFYQPNLLSYQIFISTQLHFFSNFGQSSVLIGVLKLSNERILSIYNFCWCRSECVEAEDTEKRTLATAWRMHFSVTKRTQYRTSSSGPDSSIPSHVAGATWV